MEKCKGLFQKAKALWGKGKFTKVVYDCLTVHYRRLRLENAEEGISSVCDVSLSNKLNF